MIFFTARILSYFALFRLSIIYVAAYIMFKMSHLNQDAADPLETSSGPSSKGQENDPNVNMAGILPGILQGLQTSLKQLAKSSELQTETLQNLREDLILRSDDEEIDDISGSNIVTGGSTLDLESAVDDVLGMNSTNNRKETTPAKNPDPGSQASLIDSLTQAFTSSKKTSPAIAGKIAELVDSMLVGGLSTETVKERAEKHSPAENCKYLSVTTVNEEIWDLLSRKTRSVDLAFQRVQEPLLQGLSALTNLAGKLVKDITDGKMPETRQVLDHVMDSVALLSNTNWKLNMRRRELIKPDLNSPYTRLCKEDIKPSTKLFGDELSKHLKDMSEAKKAGQQMQKAPSHAHNRGSAQEHLRGSSRMIGTMVLLANSQTASLFWGTAPRQGTPPSRKRARPQATKFNKCRRTSM